jgi:hypothetical protein
LTHTLQKIEKNGIFNDNIHSEDYILKRYYAGKETERHFKRRSFESIIQEAKNKNLWLDNIRFRVSSKGRIQLSRDGKIQFYDEFLFSDILPLIDLIMESYLESYLLFKKIDEIKKEGKTPSLKILFDQMIFVEKEDANFLINYLANYKDSDLTILSRNGAFFESTLIDYKTGSSMDICIYDSKIITLIPQYQTNTISLINLVNYLLEEYDGRIGV